MVFRVLLIPIICAGTALGFGGCSGSALDGKGLPFDAGAVDAGGGADASGDSGTNTDAGGDTAKTLPVSETFTVEEVLEERPLDTIVVVDNSGDMDMVFYQVQFNLSRMAEDLLASGLDHRLVVISLRGTSPALREICIPEPMGGTDCGDGANFLHLNEYVGSNYAFAKLVDCFEGCEKGGYGSFLHDRSLLQIVVVSNDDSRMSFSDLQASFAQFGLKHFILHAVTGLEDNDFCVQQAGEEYLTGAAETGGSTASICNISWIGFSLVLDGAVAGPEFRYPLTRVPLDDTIGVVMRSPSGVDTNLSSNWFYESATNAVVFYQGDEPPIGFQVIISYQSVE